MVGKQFIQVSGFFTWNIRHLHDKQKMHTQIVFANFLSNLPKNASDKEISQEVAFLGYF